MMFFYSLWMEVLPQKAAVYLFLSDPTMNIKLILCNISFKKREKTAQYGQVSSFNMMKCLYNGKRMIK